MTETIRPSEILIPVGYPNDDVVGGAGQTQSDYDDDSLVTVAQLLERGTFNGLHDESQRRHLAMWVGYQVEQGGRMGIGTGARSYATQLKNWQENPKQFSNPDHSYHVDRPGDGVDGAGAVDNVPGDTFGWLPGNVARFGLLVLTGNERHHTQFAETPKGAATYSKDPTKYMAKVVQPMDLPYLGKLSIKEWLKRDAPIELQAGKPRPVEPPKPEPPAPAPVACFVTRELVRGHKGADVECLQHALRSHGQPKVAADGEFGPATEGAVKAYQQAAKLGVDGRAGPRTLTSLGIFKGKVPPPPPPAPAAPVEPAPGDLAGWKRLAKTWTTPPGEYEQGDRDPSKPIKWMQAIMVELGTHKGYVDGIFGSNTNTSVKRTQRLLGVGDDGKWGPRTAAAVKARRGK